MRIKALQMKPNMTEKPIKASEIHYNNFDDMPPAPPLSKAVKAMSDAAIERRAAADLGVGVLPADFWNKAQIVEPEGTEQITLRLPRRVLGHFKATGKGYQTRISAVLATYVDAMTKRVG
jgi:uncharacterized protein (DUF4415 family)